MEIIIYPADVKISRFLYKFALRSFNNNTDTDMKWLTYILNILILSCALLTGCSDEKHDKSLEQIDRIAAVNPDSARRLLAAVDPKGLNTHDRHYLDFLRVKVNDKNYVTHTSDSLILDFIDYAERHETPAVRDEAYYYAGRVYSDLNDYPDAVRYYQKALDNLPLDSIEGNLHCRILIQAGRQLSIMRLTREAVKYFRKVDGILRRNKDTINIVHNLHLLRHSYLRLDRPDSALIYAKEALKLCPDNDIHLRAKSKMLLAEVFYKMGRNDTALKLVRHTPNEVKEISRNAALSIAANIYERAGIKDTTWMYARNLIESNDANNKHNGYRLIFSTTLFHELSSDSLMIHLLRYHDILEDYYNRNDSQQAMLQQTVYNYTLQERARAAAERANSQKVVWIAVLSIALILVLSLSLVLYEKQKRRKLERDVARSEVKRLEDALHPHDPSRKTRLELINTLRESYEKGIDTPLNDRVGNSVEYKELRRRIDGNLLMNDSDPYWSQMEEMILGIFPKLKDTLESLTDNNLTSLDWHVSIMVKCRIPQADMAKALGVRRSAITHRLYTFSDKVFGAGSTPRMMTGAIMLIN